MQSLVTVILMFELALVKLVLETQQQKQHLMSEVRQQQSAQDLVVMAVFYHQRPRDLVMTEVHYQQ